MVEAMFARLSAWLGFVQVKPYYRVVHIVIICDLVNYEHQVTMDQQSLTWISVANLSPARSASYSALFFPALNPSFKDYLSIGLSRVIKTILAAAPFRFDDPSI